MPDVAVHLGEPDALLVAVVVEEAQLDLLGHLAEDREIACRCRRTWPRGGRRCRARPASSGLVVLLLAPDWRLASLRGAVAAGRSVPPDSLPHTCRAPVSPAAAGPARRPPGRRRPPRRTAGGVVRRLPSRGPDPRRGRPDSGWRWSRRDRSCDSGTLGRPRPRTSSAIAPPRLGCPGGPGSRSDPFCHTRVVPSSRAHDHRHPAHPGALHRRQRLRALRATSRRPSSSSPRRSTRGSRTSSCSAPPAPASRRRRRG